MVNASLCTGYKTYHGRRIMDKGEPKNQQRRVVFSGRVQGVGFRYQTRDVAGRHPVRGFVQNQPDGTVLLVIEGQPQAVDPMIEDVRATMAGYIQSDSVTNETATGEFKDFSIRY
jgi:acylphosphatase